MKSKEIPTRWIVAGFGLLLVGVVAANFFSPRPISPRVQEELLKHQKAERELRNGRPTEMIRILEERIRHLRVESVTGKLSPGEAEKRRLEEIETEILSIEEEIKVLRRQSIRKLPMP